MRPLPKHPTLTPLRALDLLLVVVERAGYVKGNGNQVNHTADRTIRELTDHIKAALVRGGKRTR
jgi:hypothetical protein